MTELMVSSSVAGLSLFRVIERLGKDAVRLGQKVTGYRKQADGSVIAEITTIDGQTMEEVGALLIGVMNNGLDLIGVESYYQQVIKGGLIVAAVMLDQARHKSA